MTYVILSDRSVWPATSVFEVVSTYRQYIWGRPTLILFLPCSFDQALLGARKKEARSVVFSRSTLCSIMCFVLYGLTYALPSLLPYMLSGYGGTNSTAAPNVRHLYAPPSCATFMRHLHAPPSCATFMLHAAVLNAALKAFLPSPHLRHSYLPHT